MSQYWMLEVREEKKSGGRAVIGQQPDLREVTSTGFLDWLSGSPLDVELPDPLEFKLDGSGSNLTDFFPPAIPLMSVRMLDALKGVGVHNIETYPAILFDHNGQEVGEEFCAINIIGSVACADLDASDCDVDDPDDPVGVDFESLVIDEERASGFLFFRLYEAATGIVVHDTVREALEPLALRGIRFVDPQDWIG